MLQSWVSLDTKSGASGKNNSSITGLKILTWYYFQKVNKLFSAYNYTSRYQKLL